MAEVKKPAAKKSVASKPVAKKVAEVKEDKKAEVMARPAAEIKVAPVKEIVVAKNKVVASTKPLEAKIDADKKVATKPVKKGKQHILFVASEALPFAGTGGLGEVIGSLPKALNEGGEVEARVIMPLYESFPQEERKNLKFICHLNVPLAWRSQYCGLFEYDYNGTIFYFIDNEYYFKRYNLYGYYDDGERFAFLSRAVCELIPMLNWEVDVLHCHDWQTALVPIYYKLFYMYREGMADIKTVFTIHNIEYQGKYGRQIIEDVFGIPEREYLSIEYNGCINLMKGAIDYADAISTVSPTYAWEIKDAFYAHGLEKVLQKSHFKLTGILNGINEESYNPEANKSLFKNFSVTTAKDKVVNKTELQKMLSLPVREDVPMIALITRLVSHKGLDIVRHAMNDLLSKDVQVVVLGKGEPDYENYFTYMQKMFPHRLSSIIAFNKDLSHKIYAAADIFLMPSKSEPCGLSQMMACRYGTIPVVRATGGLKDSITDCGTGDAGNGFVFENCESSDMLFALSRAVGLYNDYRDKWNGLVNRAMTTDFSWKKSAKDYVNYYKSI